VVVSAASSSAAVSRSAAPPTPIPVVCTLPGIHYLGVTRQTHKVCLTVFATGKAVREFSFGGNFRCSDGKQRAGATHVNPGSSFTRIGIYFVGWDKVRAFAISTSGAFAATFLPPPDPATFGGKITRTGLAAGTLRLRVRGVDGGSLTCDTGTVAWRASKP
jgi:hypothetical protein